jgi:magnesium chelatase family protein
VKKYLSRISGPLLDRIDLHVEVPPVQYHDLASASAEESSATIRARGHAARTLQQQRYAADGLFCNAHMLPRHLRVCRLDAGGRQLLEAAMGRLGLSAGYDRVLKWHAPSPTWRAWSRSGRALPKPSIPQSGS